MRSLLGSISALAASKNPAASPVSYTASGRFTTSSFAGRTDNETYMRTMGSAGTVFQIVSILAGSVAAPDWRLYRKPIRDGRVRYTTGDQGSDQRTEVLQHQAINVWNKPNPFQTRREFLEASQQHMELCGEAWWVVTRDARATFPTGLWLVRPDRMEPIPSAETFIAGYVYTGPSGEKVPLGVDEVILTKFPNPLDPYRGLGPVQSILVDIDAMKYSAEWNRNFFINSAQPGGIIEVPTNMDDTEFDQFTSRWREAHQGVSRSNRVAVLEAGAKWVPTQMSLRDMDFSNLRGVSRDVIREAWGIHQAMLGNSEDVNRANAQTAEEVFGRWKVRPRLDRWESTLNERFLPMFGSTGENVEWDYVNPLPDDREADNAELLAKSTAAATLITAGFDAADVCEVVGLPEMGMAAVPPPAPAPGLGELETGSESAGEPAEDDNPFENRHRETITMRAIANAAPLHDPDPNAAPPPDLSAVDQAWQQATAQVAADYQAQIAPEQRQQVLDQIAAIIGAEVAAEVLEALGKLTVDTTKAAALLLAAMTAFSASAAHQASKEAKAQGASGVTPKSPSQAQLTAIADVTTSLMGQELAVSAGREAMRQAVPGLSGQDVADKVRPFLESLSPAGPAGHLAGAMSAAQNLARHATFTQPGAPRAELKASEILDSATCEPCEQIDGTSFGYTDDSAAIGAAFAAYPLGGYTNCLGRDRCRGTLTATYEQPDKPENLADPSVLSMLMRLEALLRTSEPAHINGHDHGVGDPR